MLNNSPAQEALEAAADFKDVIDEVYLNYSMRDEEVYIHLACTNIAVKIEKIKMLDLCRALHAEEDAILNALLLGYNKFDKCKLYTTTFPCMLCAKKIIAVGIREIIFVEPYPVEESIKILKNAQVKIEVFRGIKYVSFHKLFKKR